VSGGYFPKNLVDPMIRGKAVAAGFGNGRRCGGFNFFIASFT
jgi:hypothetical protein